MQNHWSTLSHLIVYENYYANAAETVARVPGVSIQREGGEGNKVVVRGLSPKYNSLQLMVLSLPLLIMKTEVPISA